MAVEALGSPAVPLAALAGEQAERVALGTWEGIAIADPAPAAGAAAGEAAVGRAEPATSAPETPVAAAPEGAVTAVPTVVRVVALSSTRVAGDPDMGAEGAGSTLAGGGGGGSIGPGASYATASNGGHADSSGGDGAITLSYPTSIVALAGVPSTSNVGQAVEFGAQLTQTAGTPDATGTVTFSYSDNGGPVTPFPDRDPQRWNLQSCAFIQRQQPSPCGE